MKNETVAGVCPKHGFWKGSYCSKCGKDNFKQTINIQIFKPMVYEDIDVKPMLIESKRQLKQECKKRNLIAARLL